MRPGRFQIVQFYFSAALKYILQSHPDIVMMKGECHFFDKPQELKKGLEHYKSRMKESLPHQITMEKVCVCHSFCCFFLNIFNERIHMYYRRLKVFDTHVADNWWWHHWQAWWFTNYRRFWYRTLLVNWLWRPHSCACLIFWYCLGFKTTAVHILKKKAVLNIFKSKSRKIAWKWHFILLY